MHEQRTDTYLKRMRELEVIPNFWTTQEYLATQDVSLKSDGEVMWIQEDEWAVFPPLPLRSASLQGMKCPPMKIWSDFTNFSVGAEMEFLDWEYTYDSSRFQDLSGGRWRMFRKNSRKWPQANTGWQYSHIIPSEMDIEKLLTKWLEGKAEETIQDSEALLSFVFHGTRRGFLFRDSELVGMNVWDSYEPYLMYRYCIVDPDEPFLDEFCRLLFYQSVPNYMVIDGGTLGHPGLERFKDKLLPVKKRAVYSRIIP